MGVMDELWPTRDSVVNPLGGRKCDQDPSESIPTVGAVPGFELRWLPPGHDRVSPVASWVDRQVMSSAVGGVAAGDGATIRAMTSTLPALGTGPALGTLRRLSRMADRSGFLLLSAIDH